MPTARQDDDPKATAEPRPAAAHLLLSQPKQGPIRLDRSHGFLALAPCPRESRRRRSPHPASRPTPATAGPAKTQAHTTAETTRLAPTSPLRCPTSTPPPLNRSSRQCSFSVPATRRSLQRRQDNMHHPTRGIEPAKSILSSTPAVTCIERPPPPRTFRLAFRNTLLRPPGTKPGEQPHPQESWTEPNVSRPRYPNTTRPSSATQVDIREIFGRHIPGEGGVSSAPAGDPPAESPAATPAPSRPTGSAPPRARSNEPAHQPTAARPAPPPTGAVSA